MKRSSTPTLERPCLRRFGAAAGGLRAVSTSCAFVLVLLAAVLAPNGADAQSLPAPVLEARTGVQRVDAVEVELVAERLAARAGERIELGLRIRHDPHWHTYWRNPGDSGLPTQLEVKGPAGVRADPIRWPAPQRIRVGPLANYGYEDDVLLPFTAQLPDTLAAPRVRIDAHAQWLVCKDVCIPGEARVAIDLPVAPPGGDLPGVSRHAALFAASASATPDPGRPIGATAHREGGRLALVFPPPTGLASIATAEFFPYAEGVVSAPAPQALSRTDAGWRIDLDLADGATVPASVDGLVLVNGRPFELRGVVTAGAAASGTPVSVAGSVSAPSAAGGLLGRIGSTAAPSVFEPAAPTPAALDASLALALAFGALGGLILNLMPCVFPVVGMKVLGFAKAAGDQRGARRAMRAGAFAFVAGVLVSFWALASLMLGLRAAGESIGWGFQLQSPTFVAAMALLFVAVGLNFSGVFEMGMALTRLGGLGGSSIAGSFGAGVLAVLVATPCTAPFMGSALGFTLAQPAAFTLAVFTAIGLGMALPYLLLGLNPAWVSRLPRPGRWMQTLREALAFPMYATAAWLAWVLAQQAGPDALLRLLLSAVVIGVAAWAWGRWANGSPQRVGLASAVALLSAVAAIALLAPLARAEGEAPVQGARLEPSDADGTQVWKAWSEDRVAQALADGRPVFVDFTAAWCVSCQVNKKVVLERETVGRAFRERGVVALRADWTQRDPAITAALARHGRNGVPLYLVYRPGDPVPRILPELLTASTVVDALR
jgi:thiol:disulfide interchange protein DsbD